jgi:hypothetical protein
VRTECSLGALLVTSFGSKKKDSRAQYSNSEFSDRLVPVLALEDNDCAVSVRLRTLESRGQSEDSPCVVWRSKRHGLDFPRLLQFSPDILYASSDSYCHV